MTAEPIPLAPARRWPAVLGGILTAAMIVGLARQLFVAGLSGLVAAVPVNPLYYLAFVGLYLASPLGDYVIFRRLWSVPLTALAALIRKRIANEVVFGYSGDAYFYAWARANARRHAIAAPFGAVKDVTILSAIAGNAVTLAMSAGALPFAYRVMSTGQAHGLAGSAALVCLTSLPFLLFRRRVFSLSAPVLRWIFGVHLLRIIAGSLFVAFAWSAALPGIAAGLWLLLAAGRMLVSRLPFVPNKDLLFANFAILLIGRNDALVATIAFTAALTVLVHVVLIAGFAVTALLRSGDRSVTAASREWSKDTL